LAGGLNLYGYADGDPVNMSDPFGLCPGRPGCPTGNVSGATAAGVFSALGSFGRATTMPVNRTLGGVRVGFSTNLAMFSLNGALSLDGTLEGCVAPVGSSDVAGARLFIDAPVASSTEDAATVSISAPLAKGPAGTTVSLETTGEVSTNEAARPTRLGFSIGYSASKAQGRPTAGGGEFTPIQQCRRR
jgi:hypothetical protein